MKYLPLVILLFFYSCNNDKKSELEQLVESNGTDSSKTDKYLIENLRIDYSKVIQPKGGENVIIPIVLEERYYEKGLSSYDYSNLIFYNHKNSTNNFLFNDSVDIIKKINYFTKGRDEEDDNAYQYDHSFELKGNYNKVVYDYLFLEIAPWKTKKELKEEKKDLGSYKKMRVSYEEMGSKSLSIINLKGDSLIHITPPNTRLINWEILENSSILMAKVMYDSNGDKLFNKKDEIRLLRVDIQTPDIGIPILSSVEENLIKTNLLKGKTGITN